MPIEYLRWILAEMFGWTLAEVDALSVSDVIEFFQVMDGRKKAAAQDPQPDNRPVGRRRGRR